MYVRFETFNKIRKGKAKSGLFIAVGHALKNADLQVYDRRELERLCDWFNWYLPFPRFKKRYPHARFWFRDSPVFISRMWEMANILRAYDYNVELVTTYFPGTVIYEDKWQVAAIRKIDRFSARKIPTTKIGR